MAKSFNLSDGPRKALFHAWRNNDGVLSGKTHKFVVKSLLDRGLIEPMGAIYRVTVDGGEAISAYLSGDVTCLNV